MEPKELDLLPVFSRFIQYWWVIALMTLLGGILGRAFGFIQPPVYDARSGIDITVDYSLTGNISVYNFDQAVSSVHGIVRSAEVLSKVLGRPISELSPEKQRELNTLYTIERLNDTWLLQVRNSDPATAAEKANLWREISYQTLIEARQHARTAQVLQRYLNAGNCPTPPVVTPPIPSICQNGYILDLSGLAEIQERIQQEQAASKAIQPYLLFRKDITALIPGEPVQYHMKWLVLGGMLTFFLITTAFLQLMPLRKKTR